MLLKDIEDLTNHLELAAKSIDKIRLPYMKEMEASTKDRIHNLGLDSDNKKIGLKSKRKGRYSPGYAKRKRKAEDKINLRDEGELMRAYTVGQEHGEAVLKFTDVVTYKSGKGFDGKPASLAEIHSVTYNTDIYRPSNEQLKDNEEVIEINLRKVLKNALNS